MASTLSSASTGRLASSAFDSAAGQSIGVPSRTARARSETSPSLTATFHFLREPHQRTLRRLTCRI